MMAIGLFPKLDITNNVDLFYWSDLIVVPLFMFIVYRVCQSIYEKKYAKVSYGKYFLLAVKFKLVVVILYWAVYKFYYKGGDTFVYYWHIIAIKDLLFTDPGLAFNILFNQSDFHTKLYVEQYFPTFGQYVLNANTFIVIFIGFFLGFLGLFSYLNISLLMSLFALMGCWRMYKMFLQMYPALEKEMAVATLFIPSVIFWSSGIMKDSICMGFLGVLCFSTYELFFLRKRMAKNIIYIIIAVYALVNIKVYIILSFAPALAVWVFARYRYNIKSPFLKAISTPLFFSIAAMAGVGVLTLMGNYAERYAFEQMMETAKATQSWLVYSSKDTGGSFYTLGDINYSTMGMIKIFPKAINVSLFRPYIWEAKKPMLVPAAFEGLLTMFLTIRLIFKVGFMRFFKMIADNPEVQFCMVFSIIFAFAVGFTSFNFGALARYKIPFMPFYYIALFILSDSHKKAIVLNPKIKS